MNTDFYKTDINNSIIDEDEGEMDYPVRPPQKNSSDGMA